MSVDLSWTVDVVDGVCFVACRVHNEADVCRRVRIDSRLAGPVLSPRRSGVPEAGWDRDGVTLRLDPGEDRGIGFASPAPAADPAIEIVDREPLADADVDSRSNAPAEAVRTLDEHRPPSEVVTSAVTDRDRAAADGGTTADSLQSGAPAHSAAVVDVAASDVGPSDSVSVDDSSEAANAVADTTPAADTTPTPDTDDANTTDTSARSSRPDSDPTVIGPDRIDGWFGAIERRVERMERLTDGDLDSATEEVAVLGGTDAVADLENRVGDDAALLRRVSERAASLADRAEKTDAPVEALERLA